MQTRRKRRSFLPARMRTGAPCVRAVGRGRALLRKLAAMHLDLFAGRKKQFAGMLRRLERMQSE